MTSQIWNPTYEQDYEVSNSLCHPEIGGKKHVFHHDLYAPFPAKYEVDDREFNHPQRKTCAFVEVSTYGGENEVK
jgi:hypothetical protein